MQESNSMYVGYVTRGCTAVNKITTQSRLDREKKKERVYVSTQNGKTANSRPTILNALYDR